MPKDFFYLTVKRDAEKVEEYLAFEKQTLEDIDKIVNDLTF